MLYKYYTYMNFGNINDVINRKKNHSATYIGKFNSLKEIFTNIVNDYNLVNANANNIYIKYVSYDPRLKRDVYMFVGDVWEYKQVFICFMIEN